MKRILSVAILTAMLCSMASCGEGTKPTTDTTATQVDTSAALTGREAVSDNLPDKNFGGETFTIMDRTKMKFEFEAEEETGDLINDAIYKRNGRVADRFNVTFKYFTMDCLWGEQATAFNNALRSSVLAGDGAFDLVAGYAATIPGLVSDGIFVNWADLDYVDFTKPWWSESVADELTINGKSFMVTGDISLALWRGMTCFFFNKQLAESYNVGNMYDIVKSGQWTFDKLIALTKDVYKDIDGDGEKTEGDLYGLLCMRDTEVDNMKESFEIKVTKKNEKGFPELCFVNEKTINAVKKLNSYIHDSGNVLFPKVGGDTGRTALAQAFSESRGIFFTSTLGVTDTLRSMDDDFGIIPYPKYDENQEKYRCSSLDEFSLFLIPVDAKNLEKMAIITEALCAESYKVVVPTFYDIALKTKNARDDDSAEMIDLIRDGLTFDWGYLHSGALGGAGHLFVNLIRQNDNNVASTYDSKAPTYEENLEKILAVYKD